MAPLVWLVTGSTSGIGLSLVQHIVSRGDKVIATGRKVEQRLSHVVSSDSFATLELDITAPPDIISAKIQSAWNIFGRIDVLVNNAGMSAMKPAEEASPDYISNMFSVNLFGPMNVTKAILPLLREHGSGTIAFTSSSTAWTHLPFWSHYGASKAALSAYVESLGKELRPLGIKCVSFESGGFPTSLGQPRENSSHHPEAVGTVSAGGIEAYQPGLAALGGMFMSDPMAFMPGDLSRVSERIVDIVKGEGMARGKAWPPRVLFGSDAYQSVQQKLRECGQLFEDWKEFAYSTDREGYGHVTKEEYLKAVSIF